MSNILYRLSLIYLNVFGITCHNFKKGKLIVSKPWISYSLLKIVPFFVVQVMLHINSQFRTSVLNNYASELGRFSDFSVFMLGIINLLVMTSCTLLSVFGIWKRKKMVGLFNLGCNLHSKLDGKYVKTINTNFIRLVILILVLSSGFAKIMMFTMKSEVLPTFVGVVLAHPPFALLCFMGTSKFAELFILQLLKNFGSKIKKLLQCRFGSKHISSLANEYQNTADFCNGFNSFFGIQLTMAVLTLALVTVFDASIFVLKLNPTYYFLFPVLFYASRNLEKIKYGRYTIFCVRCHPKCGRAYVFHFVLW